MTLSNSRIPVPTNKRKRTPDGGAEGPQKALKTSADGPSKQALRIVTDLAPAQRPQSPTVDDLLSSTDSENSLFDESPPQLDTPTISETLEHARCEEWDETTN